MSDLKRQSATGNITVDAAGLRTQYLEIFQDRRVFLRELIQNSIEAVGSDACRNRARIDVRTDPAARRLSVADNGQGMSAPSVRNAITSLFHSDWSRERGDAATAERAPGVEAVSPALQIGRFGMGMTTCLLVGDRYEVRTTRDGEAVQTVLRVFVHDDSASGAHVAWSEDTVECAASEHGTTVTVELSDDVVIERSGGRLADTFSSREVLDDTSLERRIRHYFSLAEVPIFLNRRQVGGIFSSAESFDNLLDGREDAPEARRGLVRIEEDGEDGYLRCVLWADGDGGREGVVQFYSRGIFVNDVPTAEVLDAELGFLCGIADTSMVDLQIDRNRVLRNARARKFRESVSLKYVEGLRDLSNYAWPEFVRFFEARRTQMLSLMLKKRSVARVLADLTPFRHAQFRTHMPLHSFLKRTLKVQGRPPALPFDSPRAVARDVLPLLEGLGAATLELSEYVPTEHGRINLDLLFIHKHLEDREDTLQCMRVDTLLREVSMATGEARRDNREEAGLVLKHGAALREFCDVVVLRSDSLQQPLLLSTPYDVSVDQELPGMREAHKEDDVEMAMRQLFGEDMINSPIAMKFAKRRRLERQRNASCALAFNLDHPLIRSACSLDGVRASALLSALGGATLLGAISEHKRQLTGMVCDALQTLVEGHGTASAPNDADAQGSCQEGEIGRKTHPPETD